VPGQPFSGPVPIGCPIPNTTLYVLDNGLQPVGPGETGELFVAGQGLGRGYHKQAGLTAERFVPNPFAKDPGARLYRTGDLVRRLGDGRLQFLGRLDYQVKVRGFRIELGEIMEVLSQHPSIKENVVTAAPDRDGGERLVAYLVARDEVNADVADIRAFLKLKLPDYMIPAVFITLAELPLTANGKFDLKALPSPDDAPLPQADFAQPQDLIETQLITIWERVLGVTHIGIDDNFFELGGHSLLAVRLFAQIENRFGKALPLATLFQASTVRELAAILREEGCREWSSLVAIRANGSRSPLFCIHAAGANILIYRPLANHLSEEQPVYALQALGLDGVTPPLTNVEEMAAHYIKEIRTLQPEGPYYLLGGSFGGLVAFEMAQQLDAQGQRVAMLALLDTYCPLRSLWQRLRGHWAHLTERGPSTYAADLFGAVGKRFGRRFLRQPSKSENGTLAATVLPKEMEYQDPLISTVEANIEAGRTYVPRNKIYRGRLLFFYAEDLGSAPAYEDNRLRWAEMAGGGFEIHRIPGTHITMREEPNVVMLAAIVENCLEQARRVSESNI
jgi:aspartate racemase